MSSRNVRDIDTEEYAMLPDKARTEIDRLVALGHDRDHLVVCDDATVFFDPELCTIDGWLSAFDRAHQSQQRPGDQ